MGGPSIELRIARIRSLAPTPAADAFTVINGGPGGSSLTLYADLAPVFTGILRERDIIVVDQRGTGESTRLTCPELEASPTEIDPDRIAEFAKRCVDALPLDPRFFTTSVAVTDLEAVRKLLGYDALTIYGVSYGTRVAQHYARRYPQRTRALIIDGVLPATMALGPQISANAQETLDSIFTRCANDAPCSAAFPQLPADFDRLRAELSRTSRSVTLADPVTGKTDTMDIGYGHLAVAVRLLSYAPETASIIPILIHEAANNDNFLPLASQALRISNQLSESLSYGMHNSVVCTEDVPHYRFDAAQMQATLDETYLGNDQLDALIAICEHWPAGVMDEDFKNAFESRVPTLLLSGEFDPITPPANAEQVLAQLPNARHLIAPGQGHGVVMRGCVPNQLLSFVETTDPETPDAQCVERLGSEPFFIDLMGPAR